jgi:TatD DNase family protein
MLVDSHCHLNFPELKDRTDDVIKKANEQGVHYFLTVNTRLSEYAFLKNLTEKYESIFCSVGVHPHDVKDHTLATLREALSKALNHPKTVALGETGLDYYYENSPPEEQKKSFNIHIECAKEFKVPLIIHTRDADEDTIASLWPYKNDVTGVFHCFSGNIDLAKKALDLGFYISFSGIITFKKALELTDVVKYVPIDRILVETDSPFLAPVPHRGRPNEPAYVRLVAEKVAELKNMDMDLIETQTTQNFFKLFSKVSLKT